MDGTQLEQVLEFGYLECVLDESTTDFAENRRKVASGRNVAVAIKFLVKLGG